MSNYAIFPVENSEDFKYVNDILGRDDIIVNSINYKTDIVKFPLIIEIQYFKKHNSLDIKKTNDTNLNDEAVIESENNSVPVIDNIKDTSPKNLQYDKVVKTHSQDDNVNDKLIIPASELKPYSTTLKENKKPKENKLYFYCSYMLDKVISNKYYTAKNKKSARDNIHNIALRYKKSKGYNKVDFEIIELKEISMAEYENSLK